MKIRHIFNKYLSIIGKLSNGRKATYEQILEHLQNEFEIEDRAITVEFSKRTFQRAIKDIYEIFNIEISCDRDSYYSATNIHQREDMQRLTQNINFNHFQKHFENFNKHIIYDNTCYKGSEHINEIQQAIQTKKCLEIKHRKFNQSIAAKNRIIAPYGLKEYSGRWYLIALDLEIKEIRTFGLDRIDSLDIIGRSFTFPEKFDLQDFFSNSIGVQVNEKAPTELVILKIDREMAEYFKTMPLHSSQKIDEETKKHTTFRYKLILNVGLENEIMRFANFISIERPITLRNKIKERLKKGVKKNK